MKKLLCFLLTLYCAGMTIACQPQPPQLPSIVGSYRGEFIAKQKESWARFGLKEAEYLLTVQPDGKYAGTAKFISAESQGVIAVEGSYRIAGEKVTFIPERLINDGEEQPVPADDRPEFTIDPSGALITNPTKLEQDPTFPARFVKQ